MRAIKNAEDKYNSTRKGAFDSNRQMLDMPSEVDFDADTEKEDKKETIKLEDLKFEMESNGSVGGKQVKDLDVRSDLSGQAEFDQKYFSFNTKK